LSQAELAAQTGLAQTYVSRIERGAVPRPRPATLRKLGDALGLRLPEFYQSASALELPAPADATPFGSWLRNMIVACGFASEREFAARAGIAPKHLSRLLTGDIKRPSYRVMWRLAGALQVPLAEVVEQTRRPAGDAPGAGQDADAATGALVALLDHLQEELEVMARLDALGTLKKALLRDIADLLTVYLRGVLRAQAARPRPRNGTSPD
jgi:transcriptional regulator with XRE-family HTH domain